jgi:hypothetical protein
MLRHTRTRKDRQGQTHTHTHTRARARTHTHARTHAHTHTRTHTRAHTHKHARAHAPTRTQTLTHLHAHARARLLLADPQRDLPRVLQPQQVDVLREVHPEPLGRRRGAAVQRVVRRQRLLRRNGPSETERAAQPFEPFTTETAWGRPNASVARTPARGGPCASWRRRSIARGPRYLVQQARLELERDGAVRDEDRDRAVRPLRRADLLDDRPADRRRRVRERRKRLRSPA